MNVCRDILDAIGNTPMLRVNHLIAPELASVFLKLESCNPYASVKDRVGAAMILDAEKRGILKPGAMIVEPTSGNTGIGLAFVCAARKYRLTLTMPDSMSIERRLMLKALGAELALTPANLGMKGAIDKAGELVAQTPGSWMPQQFENPANPAIHEATTGPEIWEQIEGRVDALIASVGTGGTITGIARFIKKHNPGLKVFAVEPAESAVISGGKPGPHKIQGIGAGFIPKNLDMSLLSGVIQVTGDEAYDWARRLTKSEAVFGGISTGANVCAAAKAIEQFKLHGKRIVTIIPSFGERYLSTTLYNPDA